MREFEKWKSENFKPEKNLVDSEDYFCGYADGLETGWRAVLEMVLGWLDYSSEHKEIADKIHDELGDT